MTRQSEHGEQARALMGRIALLELVPFVLERALEPFPLPVRTLNVLHLAAARTMGIEPLAL